MNRLISANFSRLFRSGIFRLYMVFSGVLSLIFITMRHIDYINHKEMYDKLDKYLHSIDAVAFTGIFFLIFAVPIFTGSFVGREYSDGTIRNKLITGHKRSSVYLANLIVCTVGTLTGMLLNILISFTIGAAVCGSELALKEILKKTLLYMAAFTAMTAVMVMISMTVKSKSGASVTTLILTFIMFFVTMSFKDMLDEPEYYENMISYAPETQQIEEMPKEKNPDYLTGTKRKVYQTIYDAIPVSHMYELSMNSTENAGKKAGYDGIILVVTTALGIILFRRKDLK
ncbi:MAG: ABC transporter permease [Ruminococcus sp.]|nr:ABC transporter permease [Ruminococcus sp.]